MKLGLSIPAYGPAATADSLRRWGALAEDTGLDLLMVGDHVAPTPDVTADYPGPFWDPLVALSHLAGTTRRIALGTTVLVVPLRHPVLAARGLAALDALSGGRLVVGVGVGWAREEFAALGLDPDRRGEITDEYLDAMIALWSRDVASFHGRHVRFTDVDTRPRPQQDPHPPLWVGGNGAAARRRALRLGATWHPLRVRPGWLREHGLPALRREADEQGRAVPPLAPRIVLHPTEGTLDDGVRLVGQGSPDQIRGDLDELRALGATHALFDPHLDPAVEAAHDHEHHRGVVADAVPWLVAAAGR